MCATAASDAIHQTQRTETVAAREGHRDLRGGCFLGGGDFRPARPMGVEKFHHLGGWVSTQLHGKSYLDLVDFLYGICNR